MNVKELIALLSQYPDDLPVFIRSYELGYDEVASLKATELMPNPTDHEYEGNFVTNDYREFQSKKSWDGESHPISDTEKPMNCLILIGDSRANHFM